MGVAASSDVFANYGGGVLDDFSACCSSPDCQDDINHAVVVVGYNKTGAVLCCAPNGGLGCATACSAAVCHEFGACAPPVMLAISVYTIGIVHLASLPQQVVEHFLHKTQ